MTSVPIKQANAARTTMQAGPAWVIVEFVDAFFYDMSDRQFGALVALLFIGLSYVQVVLENYAGRAFFRLPVTKAPVVTEPPKG